VHRIGATVVGLAGRPVVRDQAGQQAQAAAAHQNVGSFPANVPRFPVKAAAAASFAGLRDVIFKAAKVAAAEIGSSVSVGVANRLIAAPTTAPGSSQVMPDDRTL
jgi:hypothetical protein